MMLGSSGFEYDGEEYTATLRFAADGAYEGLEYLTDCGMADGEDAQVSRNDATAIWWGLTQQQREAVTDACWEDARLSEQSAEDMAAF